MLLAATAALFGLALVAAGLLGAGRLACGRSLPPEAALVSGWGAFCLVMTLWAIAIPLSLAIPAACLLATAILAVRQPQPGTLRIALLSMPFWLIMLSARPSQVDTWLNLLPNLAYLHDHAALPSDGGPASWSFLPAAPYNTQFAGYAVSLWSAHFVTNALSLFNALLLCAAGLHFARLCADSHTTRHLPPYWACAFGLLLVIPLNPGFVPRVFLASYGEAPIAVTLLFATALGADLFAATRAGTEMRPTLVALALVLAALVEIKQSALGLLLPFSLTLLLLGLAAPAMPRRRWAAMVTAANIPAIALYLLYRWYVLTHFTVGELKMLPLAEWHLNLLPQILAGIAFAIFQKATYFLVVIAALAAAAIEAKRRPWQHPAIVLGLAAGLIAGFNAFLLFTYVAHFPAIWAINAHSYFRYMSQLSLVVMLGLVTSLLPACTAWLVRRSSLWRHRAATTVVAITLAFPLLAARMLRFDLDAPQPFLWDIGHHAAALLHDTDRVALLLPGDGDDAVGSLLRGVLLFTEPRRPHLDFTTEPTATPAALARAHAAGFTRALVICTPGGLTGLPARTAGLLAYDNGEWRVLGDWPVPPELGRERFSAMLPREAFCLHK